MSKVIKAMPEIIQGDNWDRRMAESINRNFEKLFQLTRGLDATDPVPDGAEGDLLVANALGQFRPFAKDVNVSRYLSNRGASSIPAWSQVSLANGVDGKLPATGLDVTGTPSSTKVLWGDRWDVPAGGGTDLALKSYAAWIARPPSQIVGIGTRNPAVLGASFSAANLSDNVYGLWTTAAGSGSRAGFDSLDVDICDAQHDPTFIMVMATDSDITSIRLWLGLANGTLTNVDNPGGGLHYAAFRYSTVAGDGGWVGACRDGTTQNVSSTVATIAASTVYLLKMRFTSSAIYFSVNGGTEVSLTTNLPGSTQNLKPSCSLYNQVSSARSWYFSRLLVEYGV